MSSEYWSFASASVRGTSHHQGGTPCQDANFVLPSTDGQWIALVSSDGAGTATKSEISSKLVTEKFASALIDLSSKLNKQSPGAWVTDSVIEQIVGIRNHLRQLSGGDDISAFHCTLVAALIGKTGGFIIHIGDGSVITGLADTSGTTTINLANDFNVSLPQNGEYANETVFLTERDWIKNIRIQPFSAVDWLILGTDGGMALTMSDDNMPKTGFVTPVLQSLLSNPDRASRDLALHNLLSDKKADRLTNDDKTLIAVIRKGYRTVEGEFRATKNSAVKPSSIQTSTSSSSFIKSISSGFLAKQKPATRIQELLSIFSNRKRWPIFAFRIFLSIFMVTIILVGYVFFIGRHQQNSITKSESISSDIPIQAQYPAHSASMSVNAPSSSDKIIETDK